MSDSETYVVFGATGAQGGAVARHLATTGKHLLGLGRDAAKLKILADQGIEPFRMSGYDMPTLDKALESASKAFVCVPITVGLGTEELSALRSSICRALERSAVKRVVWTTSWVVSSSGRTVSQSFDAMRRSVDEVLGLPLEAIIIKPGGYLDNLLTPDSRASIAGGVLPYMLPENLNYRWVSSSDQARLVKSILEAKSVVSGEYAIGHLATGHELAAAASQALERPIEYTPISPEDFADQWRGEIGSAADRIAQDYLDIAQNPEWLGLQEDTTCVSGEFNYAYTSLVDFFAEHATKLTASP